MARRPLALTLDTSASMAPCLLAGDLDTGKAILRDYINATIGFDELSRRTKRPAKSLMRMLGPSGNPQACNLLEVINHLQKAEGLHFEVSLRVAAAASFLPARRASLADPVNALRS